MMVTEVKNKTLTKKQLLDGELDYIIKKTKGYTYLFKHKNKLHYVKRVGKCEPKKCKSACCKFINLQYPSTYLEQFGTKSCKGTRINVKCSQLSNNKCALWNSKKFPGACKQFPHPTDNVYIEVMDVCTFKFEILREWELK